MKIGIIGNSSDTMALSLALSNMGHELVVLCDDDIKESDELKERLITNDIVLHPPVKLEYPECVIIPERCNTFRGGNRGKGGKIKYQRL